MHVSPSRLHRPQVSVDFPASPTDHAIVAVYTTLDDASEVWDLFPMMEFLIWLSSGTRPNLGHQASGGGTVTITSSVAIVNDTTWSTIVGTWRPARLELYVDGWSRASSTAAATDTSALFGIYRWAGASQPRRTSTATSRSSRASPHPGTPPWCGAGTPIRSASCAHGARCLRSLGARHPPRPPRPAPAWSPS